MWGCFQLVLVLQALSCTVPSTPTHATPDLQGFIKEVTKFDQPGRVIGEFSVFRNEGGRFEPSDENLVASITVAAATEIYLEPLKRADFDALKPGLFVKVWLQPNVHPTYPLQAVAKAIVIQGSQIVNRPPPPGVREPIRVGARVQERKLRVFVPPVYPEALRQEGIEDTILLQVTADKTGSVVDVRTIRGNRQLAEAATQAVRQWKWEPTYLGGEPVSVIFTVAITMKPD